MTARHAGRRCPTRCAACASTRPPHPSTAAPATARSTSAPLPARPPSTPSHAATPPQQRRTHRPQELHRRTGRARRARRPPLDRLQLGCHAVSDGGLALPGALPGPVVHDSVWAASAGRGRDSAATTTRVCTWVSRPGPQPTHADRMIMPPGSDHTRRAGQVDIGTTLSGPGDGQLRARPGIAGGSYSRITWRIVLATSPRLAWPSASEARTALTTQWCR